MRFPAVMSAAYPYKVSIPKGAIMSYVRAVKLQL